MMNLKHWLSAPKAGGGIFVLRFPPEKELATHRPLSSLQTVSTLVPPPHLLRKQEASFLLLPAPVPAVLPSCQAPVQQLGPLEFSCKPPALLANY